MNSFRMITALSAAAVVSIFFLGSCTNSSSPEALKTADGGPTGIALIKMTASAGSPFAKIADSAVAVLSASDMFTLTRTLDITDTSVEGVVADIPAGKDRIIDIYVYDSLQELRYKGSGITDVVADSAVKVTIDVVRILGDVVINGNIIDSAEIDFPVVDGLVAYYPFNGNAQDCSWHANNGTVNGAALTTDRFGNENSAYLFDGTDDYIEVPYNSSLDCENAVSVTVWAESSVPHEEYTETGHIVQMGWGTERAYTIAKSDSFPGVEMQFRCEWSREDLSIINGGIRHADTLDTDWHFYALAFDGDTLRAYVDDDLIGTIEAVPGSIDDLPLRIGAQAKDLARFWNGKIDDVCIYNRGLSSDEIDQIRTFGEEEEE